MNTLPRSSILNTLKGSPSLKLAWTVLFSLAAAVLGLAAGSTGTDLSLAVKELLQGDPSSPDARILLYVRLPRVCASLLSGAALSVSGILLQAVLGNPLASPNVIGVNSGAGFFTFLALALFAGSRSAAALGAFAGALLATLLIWLIASAAGAGKLTILLAGTAVSSMFAAGLNTVKTFFPTTLYNGSTFLIGGFSGVSMKDLFPAWVMILFSLPAVLLFSRQIDVLALGEETAHSLGINVKLMRFTLILFASLLAGSAVSFSGLLSFVGLIVPHAARRLFGTEHRILLPAGAFLGAGFVTLCDLLSRVLFVPYEIPVGILLSLTGGPFFLFLILRRGRKGVQGLFRERGKGQ